VHTGGSIQGNRSIAEQRRPARGDAWRPAKEYDGRMAKITFIQPDGSEQVVDATPGITVMEAAKLNMVPGIEAECGGACACATCHVYIDNEWRVTTGMPSQMEEDMLDFAFDVRESSRLSCQIKVTPALDGLIVRVPAKQF
jgi:2Fe-2S ferredoxin